MGIENFVRPYAFERIFALSTADAERNPHDQALQILALQAELARCRQETATHLTQARAEGFAAGLAQARGETAATLLMTQQALIDGLARLDNQFSATEGRIAARAAEVAMSAAELLAAQAIAADPCLAVDAAIARVLAQVGFRETLHVHVHPDLAETLQMLVDARGAHAQRPLKVVIHADPAVPPGDGHILWDEGGLSLNRASRAAAVRDALGLDTPAD